MDVLSNASHLFHTENSYITIHLDFRQERGKNGLKADFRFKLIDWKYSLKLMYEICSNDSASDGIENLGEFPSRIG